MDACPNTRRDRSRPLTTASSPSRLKKLWSATLVQDSPVRRGVQRYCAKPLIAAEKRTSPEVRDGSRAPDRGSRCRIRSSSDSGYAAALRRTDVPCQNPPSRPPSEDAGNGCSFVTETQSDTWSADTRSIGALRCCQ